MEFINKIMVLIYILCSLNVMRYLYFFIQAWIESGQGTPVRLEMTPRQILILGLSISYVLTGIITGVTF